MSQQIEPKRISSLHFPVILEIPLYLRYFYRSNTELKSTRKAWISEFEFEQIYPEFSLLTNSQTISGTVFEAFINPESASGQAIAAVDAKIREILKIRETEEILSYQIDGDKKIISAEVKEDSVRSFRNLSNEDVGAGEIKFDDVMAQNGDLLEAVGKILFVYAGNSDREGFIGRALTELERQAAESANDPDEENKN